MSRVSNGCSLPAAGRRRASAATATGHLMVPGDRPARPRPGHPLPGQGRPGPAHRVPRRELRGDRLRLRRPERLDRGRGPSPAVSPAGSGSPTRSRRCSTGSPRPPSRPSPRGDVPTAVRLGVSMTALQASIGILNDVVDAPRDAGRKPSKPIPAGLVDARRGASRRGRRRGRSGWSSRRPPGRRRGPRRGHPRDRLRATTSAPRARPGRGRRSRSGSRCCPSSRWLGAAGSLPRVHGPPRRRRRARRRRARRSRMRGRTWSATGPRGSRRWRPRWAASARGGSRSPWSWRSSPWPWGRCWTPWPRDRRRPPP